MKQTIYIDPKQPLQTMEGFGVSGAWWARIVGAWSPQNRAALLKLLFSQEDGMGIGTYRYNLGGGSAESGKGTFPNACRRASSFDDGNAYDWSRDAAAVRVLREAVELGADDVVFFVNSPPEQFTASGATQCAKAFRENLPKKNHRKFAQYVLDVTEHFLADGIPVRTISPVNEPFWIWTAGNGQEGCHYRPSSVRAVFSVFAEEMDKRPALRDVMLSGAENGDLRFFNRAYTNAVLKNTPAVAKRLDGVDTHSYRVAVPWFFKSAKRAYRKWMDKKYPTVKLRTSEWTHMEGGRDLGMDSALEQAKIMFEDLELLRAVSWQHWVAVSDVNYNDGLIYIDPPAETYKVTKRLYAFGNFSKFVKAGFVCVKTGGGGNLQTLAFQKDNQTVLIVINQTRAAKTIDIAGVNGAAKQYITDAVRDLAEESVNLNTITIPPRSVNTVVFSS
ncbi:MAG: hypothetical protein LBB67_03705 [Oscillospiraceae bacterium]|jgi:O-glycosyl hydrolase|nr:hypothetical protein [Oscillospiraceae bacterium]